MEVSKEGKILLKMHNDVVESMESLTDYLVDSPSECVTGFDCYQLSRKNKQIKKLAAEIDMYINMQEDFTEDEQSFA